MQASGCWLLAAGSFWLLCEVEGKKGSEVSEKFDKHTMVTTWWSHTHLLSAVGFWLLGEKGRKEKSEVSQ